MLFRTFPLSYKVILLFIFLGISISPLFAQPIEPVVQFGHEGRAVREIAISPDGLTLASCDGTYIKLWDMETGLEFRSFAFEPGELSVNKMISSGALSSIQFSADSELLYYQNGGSIYVRNLTTGNLVETIAPQKVQTQFKDEAIEDDLASLVFSPDGKIKALCSQYRINIREVSNNRLVNEIKTEFEDYSDESNLSKLLLNNLQKTNKSIISPDNRFLLHKSHLFDIQSGEIPFALLQPEDSIYNLKAAAFEPEGEYLACGRLYSPFKIDTTRIGVSLGMYGFLSYWQLLDELEGELLVIYDLDTGKPIRKISTVGIFDLAFTSDGSKLITGHVDDTLRVWDWKQGLELFKVALNTASKEKKQYSMFEFPSFNGAICLMPNANEIITRGTGTNAPMGIWNIETGQQIAKLGANIPSIGLEIQQSASDSIILREYEEKEDSPFAFSEEEKKIYKGYRILNLADGKVPHAFSKFENAQFSLYGNRFLRQRKDGPIEVYDSEFGEKISVLENSLFTYDLIIFDEAAQRIGASKGKEITVWKVADGQVEYQFNHYGNVMTINFDPTGRFLASAADDETVVFWSLKDGEEIRKVKPPVSKRSRDIAKETAGVASKVLGGFRGRFKKQKSNAAVRQGENISGQAEQGLDLVKFKKYYDISFSQNGNKAALWADNYSMVGFLDMSKPQKKIKKYKGGLGMWANQKIMGTMSKSMDNTSPEQDSTMAGSSFVFPSSNIFNSFLKKGSLQYQTCLSKDGNLLARQPHKKDTAISIVRTTDPDKKKWLRLEDSRHYNEGLCFSADSKWLAATSQTKNAIRIWDTSTGKIVKTLEGHSGKIVFGPNRNTLISSGHDRQVRVWDVDKNEVQYSFIGIKGSNDYIILLPSGYYTTSRRNTNALAFRVGKKAYPFEQFDMLFQRPDIVLRKIGQSRRDDVSREANEVLALAYEKAHQKRLEKLQFEVATSGNILNLPKIQILPTSRSSQEKQLSITIQAQDDHHHLAYLNIYVNGVPLFGKSGKDLSALATQTHEEIIPLTLSNGENNIQAVVWNIKGVESLNASRQVRYTGPSAPSDIHLVMLGASDFPNDESMKLNYPVKDIQDISKLIVRQNKSSEKKIHHHTFVNQDFTQAQLSKLDSILRNTKVDDTVIMVISTHGLLTQEMDYFLATYDIDFLDPEAKGLAYDWVEELMSVIPARNKVVFIDACHAGEIDLANFKPIDIDEHPDGEVKFRKFRSANQNGMGIQNSFDLMKTMFIDLRHGSGTTVIASASGAEAAIEGEEWNNSVFTYCLSKGLRDGLADLNHDQKITITELQDYLPKMVSRLTKGLQQPTFRTENIHNDWQFWK